MGRPSAGRPHCVVAGTWRGELPVMPGQFETEMHFDLRQPTLTTRSRRSRAAAMGSPKTRVGMELSVG